MQAHAHARAQIAVSVITKDVVDTAQECYLLWHHVVRANKLYLRVSDTPPRSPLSTC